MVQLAHDYLIEYLTNKRAELADTLFDEAVVHKDVVGAARRRRRRRCSAAWPNDSSCRCRRLAGPALAVRHSGAMRWR